MIYGLQAGRGAKQGDVHMRKYTAVEHLRRKFKEHRISFLAVQIR